MWRSRNKTDLIIEVWEKLDCESVGREELEAIEVAVAAEYGGSAVEPVMSVARSLADEGAVLRHSEIMELYLDRAAVRTHEAELSGIVNIESLSEARDSIASLDRLRRKYWAANDAIGQRLVREAALEAKGELSARIKKENIDPLDRQIAIELSEWLSHWLQTPSIFFEWLDMRQRSTDFLDRFGSIADDDKGH